jgi:hypothetical protein
MNRRTKQIGAVLALMSMAFFSFWGFWYWVSTRAVSDLIRARTQVAVEKNPQLKTDWEQAIADDVLTHSEAEAILTKAGEKLDVDS